MNSKKFFRFCFAALSIFLFCTGGSVLAQTPTLLIDLDARRITDPAVWPNRGTLGDFALFGNPAVQTVSGVQAVTFPGDGSAYVGPASVAGIQGNHARSIEVWVFNPSIADEETMVAWGKRGGPNGSNMSFNYGYNSSYGAVGHWGGNFDLGWGTRVPLAGQWHFLVYVYDGAIARVYDTTVLANQRTVALNTHPSNPVVIAAQNSSAGQPQAALSGSLSIWQVRVRDSALTAEQIAQNFAQDAGALQAVHLQMEDRMVLDGVQTALVTADYANITNVAVTALTTNAFQSSDTNVLVVNSAGTVTATGLGTATLTVTFQGKQTEQTITVVQPAPAVLAHRYSFNEPAGSATAKDSVGTADGTLMDSGGFNGTGQLELPGGAVGSGAGYINLPNGIISSLRNVTIETWFTWNGGANWQRLFDFGNSVGGEDLQGGGLTYLFLAPQPMRFATRLGGAESPVVNGPALLIGQEYHVVVVYNYDTKAAKLFINGRLVASGVITIPLSQIVDINNWIGKSQYNDPFFNGRINEFRIYDGALSDFEVAVSAAAGPETPRTNPGTLQAITLSGDASIVINGFAQAVVTAQYSEVAGLDLTGSPQVYYQSSDTNVISVAANGQMRANNLGTATITATYQGKQASRVVTVTLLPAVLKNRYSFNEAAGNFLANDSIGQANGVLVGGAAFTGNGKLVLDGLDGYVDLPNGIISKLTNATFEVWVTWNSANMWERVFDFGNSSAGEDQQGTGTTYLFLTPRGGNGVLRFAITTTGGGAGEQIVNGTSALLVGQETHVVVTYNYSGRIEKLYVDGQLVGSQAVDIALKTIQDVNNWLGRSLYSADRYLNGQYNEFRIYEGVLSDFEVLVSNAAGPDRPLMNPGTLQSVALRLDATLVHGGFAQAVVLGNYSQVSGVNLSSLPEVTYQSSNTNAITVDAKGLLKAVGLGSATITASYQGKQDSRTVTVVQPPAVLKHRFSFNENAASIIAKDSVGNVDAMLIGGAGFNGSGQLVLDGSSGYVDLPNGLISKFTDATFEAWVTWNASVNTWERVFDFGNSTNGEDAQGDGTTYLFLTPRGGSGVVRFGITVSGGGAGERMLNAPSALPVGQQTHLVVVYNYSGRLMKMYFDGRLVDSLLVDIPLSAIQDVNNWLGRSQFVADAFFNGQYNEFRIYEGALTDFQVSLSTAAGPDVLGTAPGELQKLEVQASTNDLLLGGMLNVAVLATYQNVANVNVSAQPETVYQTTDPQVITVDKTGRIQAMGLGTASIIATWQNLKATNTFTVTAVPGVPAKPTLVHRYNFSDATGSTTVKDLVGSADGVIVGGTPQFTADGRLNLNGAYVQLPAGIIGSLTNITVETWVTWNGGADWQRVFDFGSTSGTPGAPGAGITWFGIAPRRGDSQCMGFAVITPGQAETIMNAPAALPIGQETHLVLSYNYLAGVVRLYQNGQLLALLNVSHPLSNLQDTFNVIGFSEWTWDPTFNGQFNEFRLYSGAFLDTDVNASLAAGPDALPGIEVKVQLKIERAGTNVILSWPTSAVGFALESTASLNSPINWSPVNDTPVQEGDMYKVTLSVSPTMQFFRLKK